MKREQIKNGIFNIKEKITKNKRIFFLSSILIIAISSISAIYAMFDDEQIVAQDTQMPIQKNLKNNISKTENNQTILDKVIQKHKAKLKEHKKNINKKIDNTNLLQKKITSLNNEQIDMIFMRIADEKKLKEEKEKRLKEEKERKKRNMQKLKNYFSFNGPIAPITSRQVFPHNANLTIDEGDRIVNVHKKLPQKLPIEKKEEKLKLEDVEVFWVACNNGICVAQTDHGIISVGSMLNNQTKERVIAISSNNIKTTKQIITW